LDVCTTRPAIAPLACLGLDVMIKQNSLRCRIVWTLTYCILLVLLSIFIIFIHQHFWYGFYAFGVILLPLTIVCFSLIFLGSMSWSFLRWVSLIAAVALIMGLIIAAEVNLIDDGMCDIVPIMEILLPTLGSLVIVFLISLFAKDKK